MNIEPGRYYRRKSDGAKLMALELDLAQALWHFAVLGGQMKVARHDEGDVGPWTEPRKKVKLWPALCQSGKDHVYYVSNTLYPDAAESQKYNIDFVRLLTEYPEIEVEEP